MNKVIEVEGLSKYYGKHKGIENVSFSVNKGEIYGFLGPNGAGKSTTIRSMLGLIKYNSGSIKIFGKDVEKELTSILADTGYMPSEAMFYPEMRVKDIIKLSADMRKKDCREEAGKLCERLALDKEKRINELSLGNRKKVSIVCAMQHKPKLFIFDEPTSGLDPLMQAEFFDLIKEYVNNGTTCMLSTHILSEVKRYCDKVAIMKSGSIVCVDSVANLTRTASKHVSITKKNKHEDFIYSGNINELIKSLAGQDIIDITIEEPSLEETFMNYY